MSKRNSEKTVRIGNKDYLLDSYEAAAREGIDKFVPRITPANMTPEPRPRHRQLKRNETRHYRTPQITVMQRSPNRPDYVIRQCWKCKKVSSPECPNPGSSLNSTCPEFIYDPQIDSRCPKCHIKGGFIQAVPKHKGKHTYTYYQWNHYDPTKKNKRRPCYLGNWKSLPPGLQQKLIERGNRTEIRKT